MCCVTHLQFWPTLHVSRLTRITTQCVSTIVICRVGQNRIYTYIYTVYLVISKPKIPYVHRIYMVLANPSYLQEDLQGCDHVLRRINISGPPSTWVGSARTVYIHRIWPYIWWFPFQTHFVYNLYICMVLAKPIHEAIWWEQIVCVPVIHIRVWLSLHPTHEPSGGNSNICCWYCTFVADTVHLLLCICCWYCTFVADTVAVARIFKMQLWACNNASMHEKVVVTVIPSLWLFAITTGVNAAHLPAVGLCLPITWSCYCYT